MADTLKQLGRFLGQSVGDINTLKSKGGLIGQIERTRGQLAADNTFIAPFAVPRSSRTVYLTLSFYKSPA